MASTCRTMQETSLIPLMGGLGAVGVPVQLAPSESPGQAAAAVSSPPRRAGVESRARREAVWPGSSDAGRTWLIGLDGSPFGGEAVPQGHFSVPDSPLDENVSPGPLLAGLPVCRLAALSAIGAFTASA